MSELSQTLASLAGRPGVDRARRVLRWVVPGTDSMHETRTRLVLVRAGLPQPQVNLEVRCAGQTFYLDMAYLREKVAVEYDGAGHVGNTKQMAADDRRRLLLQEQG